MTDLHPIDLQEWKVIYGSKEMNPDELVAKLYDMASYFASELGAEGNYCAANITTDDVAALNLAISALGGTPVKLMEQDEAAAEIPF